MGISRVGGMQLQILMDASSLSLWKAISQVSSLYLPLVNLKVGLGIKFFFGRFTGLGYTLSLFYSPAFIRYLHPTMLPLLISCARMSI